MKENLDSKVSFKNGEFEVSVFEKEQAKAEFGKPYSNLQEEKRRITLDQDAKDKRELAHENLKEMLKHHEDAVKNIKAEIAALEKDMKQDEGDIRNESDANMVKDGEYVGKPPETKMEGDAIRGYPRKPIMAEMVKDGEYVGKAPKTKVEGDAVRGYPRKPIVAEMVKDGEYVGKAPKTKVEGDAVRGYPRKPIMAEMVKDGEYVGKAPKTKVEGDAVRGYPRKPMMAEMVKDGEYVGKAPKTKVEGDAVRGYPRKPVIAEMTDKQKSALDKNKDGKITKEDFQMLRKDKKKSDGKDEEKIKPKASYAEMLSDIAAERFGKKKEAN